METKHTLTSMFQSNKQVLEQQLAGLALPKDANKIQSIVNDYLNDLFNQEGEYRQNLTQAEDYILQAALSLLNAQQDMSRRLSEKLQAQPEEPQMAEEEKLATHSRKTDYRNITLDGTKALMGVGGGAIVGKAILGGWGAVFGAIAGTALVLYMSAQTTTKPLSKPNVGQKVLIKKEDKPTPIDVDAFIAVISRTCESVDSLINTFRAQIQRVVNKYESQEKPTLEREYSTLLESIQSLFGVAYTDLPDEKRLKKMDDRIEQLAEALENYELKVITYSDEKKELFEELPSVTIIEPTMVCPAIVKNNRIVLKGKVFVKA